ncbi:MAG: DUF1508 domain-containing protein [bacterium]
MIYWIYEDKDGLWSWYLKSANDEKIANSGEGYHNFRARQHDVDDTGLENQRVAMEDVR